MPQRPAKPEYLTVAHPHALVSAQGKDLSGQEFTRAAIKGENFFESIFNGCRFEELQVAQSVFQHAEFTETAFVDCTFEDTSFDHSDFVLAAVTGTEFVRCSFQNAEWRDTVFEDVRFRQCIFRNTTTSLTQFRGCSFDDASASSFVGASKRFTLFSETHFYLPSREIEFLRTNFGVVARGTHSHSIDTTDDSLFALATARYGGALTSEVFHRYAMEAFERIFREPPTAQRLRLRYLVEVCKTLTRENLLSVFALQLLDHELSRSALRIKDRDHALQFFGLLMSLRVALRERLSAIEEDLRELPTLVTPNIVLNFEFENTYERAVADDYLGQLAAFCGCRRSDIVVREFRHGSTTIEALLKAAAPLLDVVRFIRCSLSLATVTLKQGTKLKKALKQLRGARSRKKSTRRRAAPKGTQAVAVTQTIVGARMDEAKPVEIFIERTGSRVLVVDGRVRITVSLSES